MITVDDYILGNGVLHEQFRATTEILGAFVASAPRPVTIAQLHRATGRSTRELGKLCAALLRSMLTVPDRNVRGSWTLACAPSAVTLEDVFRCVIENHNVKARPAAATAPVEVPRPDVDLLVMQATMAINQSILQHLRQFSLDRLKISSAARPPERRQGTRPALYDNKYDFEVNPWLI